MLRILTSLVLLLVSDVYAQGAEVYKIDHLVKAKLSNSSNVGVVKFRLFVDDETYRYEYIEQRTSGFEHSNLVSRDVNKMYSYHIGSTKGNIDYHLTNVPRKEYNVVDSLPIINWKITSDRRKIGSFYCTKAVGNYRGRVVEAFFIESVPISIGPNNLNGLPGAIIYAQSHDQQYIFEALKVSKIPRPDDFVYYPNFDFGELTPLREYLEITNTTTEKTFQAMKSKYLNKENPNDNGDSKRQLKSSVRNRASFELLYEWEL